MDIEIIGVAGFVFAATSAGALVYERRTDVLYGPYIEGRRKNRLKNRLKYRRKNPLAASTNAIWKPMQRLADQLRWRARNAIYLAAIVPC
jgi:hypothetical protein